MAPAPQHAQHRPRQQGQPVGSACGKLADTGRIECQKLPAVDEQPGGYEECNAQHRGDQVAPCGSIDIEAGQHEEREGCARHAAARKSSDHGPVDRASQSVDQAAAGLGRRCIEQIGAHRGRRMDPEQQDEQRRHERPAADPRHPHQQATDKPADRVQRIYRMHGRLPPLGNVATEKGYATISAL
jgi:hypothetical protein